MGGLAVINMSIVDARGCGVLSSHLQRELRHSTPAPSHTPTTTVFTAEKCGYSGRRCLPSLMDNSVAPLPSLSRGSHPTTNRAYSWFSIISMHLYADYAELIVWRSYRVGPLVVYPMSGLCVNESCYLPLLVSY